MNRTDEDVGGQPSRHPGPVGRLVLVGLAVWTLQTSSKEFHCLITDPPFPRLSQRDLLLAELRRASACTSTTAFVNCASDR